MKSVQAGAPPPNSGSGAAAGSPPPPPPPGGERAPVDPNPPDAAQVQQLAAEGARALARLSPGTRDELVRSIPGTLPDIAQALVGGALDNRLLSVTKERLVETIVAGQTPVYAAAARSGERVGDLRDLLDADFPKVPELARTLASMVHAAQVSPESFERLVRRLEVLRDIGDKRELAMISNRELKGRVQTFTNGNLHELLGQVARELAQLAYDPLRSAARAERLL